MKGQSFQSQAAEKTESLLFCFGAPAASFSLTSHADYYTSAHSSKLIIRTQNQAEKSQISATCTPLTHYNVKYKLSESISVVLSLFILVLCRNSVSKT